MCKAPRNSEHTLTFQSLDLKEAVLYNYRTNLFCWAHKRMFCKNCGKELPDDARYCHYCGTEQFNTETMQESVPNGEPKPLPAETPPKKSHGFLIFFIVVVIIGICIFGIVKFVQYQRSERDVGVGTTQGNHDGDKHLLKRSANRDDISVSSDLDLASFGGKYSIIPQTDIDGLEITINYLDSNRNVLQSLVKSLGNVKKGVQVEFSVSLFDLGLSVAWNTEYESIVVTGGTVSYFA